MKPATVRREAHRLMKNPNIATTVSTLNKTADQQTVDLHIADRSEVLETLTRMMRGEKIEQTVTGSELPSYSLRRTAC